MKKQKFKLGILLFGLGFIGILTTLTTPLPMDALPKEITGSFSENMIKILLLINPTLLLLAAVVVGVLLYEKVNFKLPMVNSIIGQRALESSVVAAIFKSGLLGGLVSGVLLLLTSEIFSRWLLQEWLEMGSQIQLNPLVRLLYGGITEEILLRFGFMTFVVWLVSKLSGGLHPGVYWTGLVISSVVFAASHFPVIYQSVATPSAGLLLYVLTGNTIGGLVFGWLYWKKGLEAAIIAHMFAHVCMMAAEKVGNFVCYMSDIV